MKDGIIKGTGNSRYLKSSIAADITLAQLVSMLRAGTFPVDWNGLNSDGWDTIGTALNKANLLTDATAQALGLESTDPTINEALAKLKTLVDAVNTNLATALRLESGTYIGTGGKGSANPNTLTFDIVPHIVWITATGSAASGVAAASLQGTLIRDEYSKTLNITWGDKSVAWYMTATGSTALADVQYNRQGVTYAYYAI